MIYILTLSFLLFNHAKSFVIMKNPVEQFLLNEKERKNAFEKQERENHLISLGLIDEEKSTRIYLDNKDISESFEYDKEKKKFYIENKEKTLRIYKDYLDDFTKSTKFDTSKNMYYIENCVAPDITDEQWKEICELYPPKQNSIKLDYKLSGVKILNTTGKILLYIAPIALFIAIIILIVHLLRSDSGYLGTLLAFSFLFLKIALYSFGGGLISLWLSTTAKTSLYKRAVLETQHHFEE